MANADIPSLLIFRFIELYIFQKLKNYIILATHCILGIESKRMLTKWLTNITFLIDFQVQYSGFASIRPSIPMHWNSQLNKYT